MPKDVTLQVRMDAQLKQEAEELFRSIGTSFAEAVRMFARQSVLEQRIPFVVGEPTNNTRSTPRQFPQQAPQILSELEAPSAFGMLARYADPQKQEREKAAWRHAAAQKHAEGKVTQQ